MTDFESLSLEEQNTQLRAYQMGKIDIDPRTGKSRAESQADYEKSAAEHEANLLTLSGDPLNEAEAAQSPASDEATHEAVNLALPTADELQANNTRDQLVELATEQGVNIDGLSTKQDIANAIVAART